MGDADGDGMTVLRRERVFECPDCGSIGWHSGRCTMFPGALIDAGNVVEVVRTADTRRAVVLADDERKALAWAARKGAHLLRAEGWADMKRNAEILDGVLPRLEGEQ